MQLLYFRGMYDEALTLLGDVRDCIGSNEHLALDEQDAVDSMIIIRECNRIVCRLLQVMAWLMIERAIHDEEVARDDPIVGHCTISAPETCIRDACSDGVKLPDRIRELLQRSLDLYIRAMRISTQSEHILKTLVRCEQLSQS